MLNLWD